MLDSLRSSFSEGGRIELEQRISSDSPLAVHCLYGGRNREHRRDFCAQVCQLGRPSGGGSTRLSLPDRSVLVRIALCRQVGERATY